MTRARRTATILVVALFGFTSVALATTKFTGTNNSDGIVGTTGPDAISALGGNDKVVGRGYADSIDGGSGNDTLYGDGTCPAGQTNPSYCATGETVLDGNDNILGGSGDDAIFGQGGNDDIDGGSGTDTISGGSGNDQILARDDEKDTIDCGPGTDKVTADKIDVIASNCETVSRK